MSKLLVLSAVVAFASFSAASAADLTVKDNSNWFGNGTKQVFSGSRPLMLTGPIAKKIACDLVPGKVTKSQDCSDAADLKLVSPASCGGRKGIYRIQGTRLHIAACVNVNNLPNVTILGVNYTISGKDLVKN